MVHVIWRNWNDGGYEDEAKSTFEFLKKALKQVSPELPFRGPESFYEEDMHYTFKLVHGDITDALWKEEVTKNGILEFTQIGTAGIFIHKDQNKKPLLPWKL